MELGSPAHASPRLKAFVALTALIVVACSRTDPLAPVVVGCDDCLTLTGALVLQGEQCVPGTVVLRGDRIEQVAEDDAIVVAGAAMGLGGRTVLPGLLDMHVHVTSPSGPESGMAGDALVSASFRAMLRTGVLTGLDLGASEHVSFEYRSRIGEGDLLAPVLAVAGPILTPSGGHPCYAGSLPGDTCVLVDTPPDATAAVSRLASERADVVKAVIESGREGFVLPAMRPEVLAAIVREAQARGVPVVAHVSHAADLDMALDAGVRVFAHVPVYDRMTGEQARRLAAAGGVVIPTLAVRDGNVRLSTGTMRELDDSSLADDVPAAEIEALKVPSKLGKVGQPENLPRYEAELANSIANLRRCLGAGVVIAAGTDAGNLGVFHGIALSRELELYVAEGMTAGEALRSATRVPADVLGLGGRGRIERGADADLLIVRGNPCERIGDVREVEAVYRGGRAIDREALSLRHVADLHLSAAAGLGLGETCLRAGECGAGLACDAQYRCRPRCDAAAECGAGAVCESVGWPETAATCQTGDSCDLIGQDCPNAAACVWLGNGVSRCDAAGPGADGQPCMAWGGCSPGLQCDSGGICRALCDPGGTGEGCTAGEACVDDSDAAGLGIGHCE